MDLGAPGFRGTPCFQVLKNENLRAAGVQSLAGLCFPGLSLSAVRPIFVLP